MDLTKTGVYSITNTVNGKQYIGSAARSFKYRFDKHINLLKRNEHPNIHLQNSFNKHGEGCFSFDIIGYYPKCFVLKAEQFFIDRLKPQYNKAPVAGSMLGFKHSEATKQKLKERMKDFYSLDENRKRHGEILKKTFSTKEYKEENSKRRKAFFLVEENLVAHKKRRREYFEKQENREKHSIAQKKRFQDKDQVEKMREIKSKFVYVIQKPDGQLEETFSLTLFAKQHGLSDSNLKRTLMGFDHVGAKCTQHKGYKVLSKTPRQK